MVDETQGFDEAQAQEQAEKMLPQSEVNNLIGRAKAEAQEKARRQAEAEFQQKLEQVQAQKKAAEARGEDTREIDADAIYQQVQERLQQQQLEQHMQQVADSYQSKIADGGKDYEDFQDVVKEFNPAEFPQIVYLVANMDNAADIVYELSKNPQKLATIDYLSQRSPQRAQSELSKIGQSIAANKIAQAEENQAQTPEPLDRLQASSKTGSNGQMSVGDLRNQPWLRG